MEFKTTCGATNTNCNGIDYKTVEYFDDAGAEGTGADLSAYEAPTSCDVTVSDLSGLRSAVTNSANANKTICVEAGTYSGQIDITVSGITLASKAEPTADEPATIDVSGESGYGILVEANDVTIKGFEIIGVPVGAGGISWDSGSADNPTIKTVADGTTVRDCLFSKPSGAKGKEAMVAMPGTSDIKFINNEVDDYVYGITARGSGWGDATPDEGVTNLEVSSNTFNVAYIRNDDYNGGNTNIVGEGVQIHYGDEIVVADNTINGPGKFNEEWGENDLINSIGIADYMSGYGPAGTVTYRNNKVENSYVAVATFAGNGEITANTVTGSTIGIQVGQNSDVYIDTPAEGVGITSNQIENNEKGIWVQNFVEDGLTANQNNLVSNTEYDVQNDDSDAFDTTNNWWGTDGISTSGDVETSWKSKEGTTTLNSGETDYFGILVDFPINTYPDDYTITSTISPAE